LVVGIDGGEWKVIERMWSAGRMQNLRALADRGTRAVLRTEYGKSPVIWTTIATGVGARRHGIRDFVVPTPQGDIPVASNLRRVPALWNMLTTVGRRVGVVHWWASWPAEQVNGVVVSDRSTFSGAADRIYPGERAGELDAAIAGIDPQQWPPLDNDIGRVRDLLATEMGVRLMGEDLDLLMVYLRSPDLVSHPYWRYFEPEAFPPLPAEELAANAERIPAIYDAVDQAIGRMMAAASGPVNVMVLSDHGFKANRRDEIKALWRLDPLLERLGLQRRREGRVDMAGTQLYSHISPEMRRVKMVRYALAGREPGGGVLPGKTEEVRAAAAEALARVRFADGTPAFLLRSPTREETKDGADLAVELVRQEEKEIFLDGEAVPGVIIGQERISGTHRPHTHGILVAAGPDLVTGATVERISIFDIAPTLLYALGLPVAEDFSGRVAEELFTPEFRQRMPLEKISSWGGRATTEAKQAEGDEQLLEELRALGYLD
jgi:predicted AlkP superfamily phosphohydrolase/phosphomutase